MGLRAASALHAAIAIRVPGLGGGRLRDAGRVCRRSHSNANAGAADRDRRAFADARARVNAEPHCRAGPITHPRTCPGTHRRCSANAFSDPDMRVARCREQAFANHWWPLYNDRSLGISSMIPVITTIMVIPMTSSPTWTPKASEMAPAGRTPRGCSPNPRK